MGGNNWMHTQYWIFHQYSHIPSCVALFLGWFGCVQYMNVQQCQSKSESHYVQSDLEWVRVQAPHLTCMCHLHTVTYSMSINILRASKIPTPSVSTAEVRMMTGWTGRGMDRAGKRLGGRVARRGIGEGRGKGREDKCIAHVKKATRFIFKQYWMIKCRTSHSRYVRAQQSSAVSNWQDVWATYPCPPTIPSTPLY